MERPGLMTFCSSVFSLLLLLCILPAFGQTSAQWLTYEGKSGPGKGKHIVLISGDEEYRSEEALPMMAKILAEQHGFKCTVLFPIDPTTGTVDPNNQTNIPGLNHLQTADLVIMALRFREFPDDQMKYFDQYIQSGKPYMALRTSTHAFQYKRNLQSPYAKYSFDSKVKGWEGGFGKKILGETWVAHHGHHGKEGTRGLTNGLLDEHPILKGVKDIWGYTDVYTIKNLNSNSQVLLYGQTSSGMSPETPPNYTKSLMPVAWVQEYKGDGGKVSRVFATTMGASVDLKNEDLRRLLVNGCYWGLKMEQLIPEKNNVEIPGVYSPTMFGFNAFRKGLKPADFELK
jgi:Trehalose utilisation